ncbi:hypothetical protein J7L01_05445, partial [bacterium]|nr:hypothetical protein [bacterium]
KKGDIMPTFVQRFIPEIDPYGVEFFNQNLIFDLDVCLDANLIFTRGSDILRRIHIEPTITYDIYIGHLLEAVEDNDRQRFANLINVSECPEIGFGYSSDRHGVAFGPRTIRSFVANVWRQRDLVLEHRQLGLTTLIVPNVSGDRISDLTAGIVKRDLIEFTQRICRQYGIRETREVVVHNIFNPRTGNWETDTPELPYNDSDNSVHEDKGIILIPRDTAIGRLITGYSRFRDFVIDNGIPENLRNRLGLQAGENPDQIQIRTIAQENHALVRQFINQQMNWLNERYNNGSYKCRPRKQYLG